MRGTARRWDIGFSDDAPGLLGISPHWPLRCREVAYEPDGAATPPRNSVGSCPWDG